MYLSVRAFSHPHTVPTVWVMSMWPLNQTRQPLPLDYHTPRNDSNQLTSEDRTPERNSSNSTFASLPRQSVAADCSPPHVDRDISEQRSPAAVLQERHEKQEFITRQRLRESRVVSSPPSLPSAVTDLSHFPRLGPAASAATYFQRPFVSTELKPRVSLPPQTGATVAPGQIIQSSEFPGSGSSPLRGSDRLRRDLRRGSLHQFIGTPNTSAFLQTTPRVRSVVAGSPPVPSNPDADRRDSLQTSAEQGRASGDVMASLPYRVSSGDARRPTRLENRQPVSTVMCRNGPQCRKFLEGNHIAACHVNYMP